MNQMGKKINADTDIFSKGKYSLSNIEAKLLGIDGNENNAFVILKYFDGNFQCFSQWSNNELKDFTNFIGKINNMTWNEIYKTAGKGKAGKKTGFGYTVHKDKSVLPNQLILDKLSEDITFFELRVSQEARVHGFRVKSAFFLVWLDRGHDIYPM